jgi:PadR family transcriptional regulator, regulatory protein PadR
MAMTSQASPLPLLQGTLDLLVLRSLGPGPRHGYAIATAIAERTAGTLTIEDAALYQALHRLERQELIEAEWGPSENNRRARFYALTAAGRKRLKLDTEVWRRYSRAVEAVLQGA